MSLENKKRVVCLANSWKPDGRCVAAKEIVGKNAAQWLRPVSAREGGSLSIIERSYDSNKEVEVGDVLKLTLLGPRAHAYQSENMLVDSRKRWVFGGKATFEQLASCVDKCTGTIWINGFSSNNGVNDQVPLDQAPSVESTLKMIRLPSLCVKIQHEEWNGDRKRRTRGKFSLNGHKYVLSITDPRIRDKYAKAEDGNYQEEDALVCISLGEPWHGYAYKIIASVITK